MEYGCFALHNIIVGGDNSARRRRAVDAGARRAASAAQRAHPDSENVQSWAQKLLDLR